MANVKRSRGRGRKPGNNTNRSYESNGPDVKIRGNAAHISEKYQQLARDAAASGDRIAAENYLQHAEHYYRLVLAAQQQNQQAQEQREQQQNNRQNNQSDDDSDSDGNDNRQGGHHDAQNADDGGNSGGGQQRRRGRRRRDNVTEANSSDADSDGNKASQQDGKAEADDEQYAETA